MPSIKRIKTGYPGVYYIMGQSPGGKPERIYYIRFRRDGKESEEKAGREFKDVMTPEKAAKIRAEILEQKRAPLKDQRAQGKTQNKAWEIPGILAQGEKRANSKLLEEKWLLFTKSATDSFTLLDSELNLVEVNESTLRKLYPPGTKAVDIIGKNVSDVIPEIRARGEYAKFMEVLKTGVPIVVDDVINPPPMYGNRRFKYKAFKVGDGLGMIITDITDRKRKEAELRKREAELETKTLNLEEANTALKVLLNRRNEDKKEFEGKIIFNVKELIEPYVEKMKGTKLDARQKAYMSILESNLRDIISPFVNGMATKHLGLTHTEIQIANLVKGGKSTKEIGELMHLSVNTIDSYRKRIRKKLDLSHKKVNLRTYLSSIK